MSNRAAKKKYSPGLTAAYRILQGIAALLALVLTGGSIYAIVRGPAPEKTAGEAVSGEAVFTGLGQIRAQTAPPDPATVIVSISFPYPADDREFSGEIAVRAGGFRDAAAAYFQDVSAADLRMRGEDAVKSDILALFNGVLRLGQIDKLYFSDYLVIE